MAQQEAPKAYRVILEFRGFLTGGNLAGRRQSSRPGEGDQAGRVRDRDPSITGRMRAAFETTPIVPAASSRSTS
jgi:hypothetical protein